MTDDKALSRQERLSARMQVIRARRAEREPNDKWMLIVGGGLLPLGLALVVLGWAGVSNSVLVYRQLTYLVSGGLLGIALVITGGFIYFTYWQTKRVREARAQHEVSQATLLRIEALLRGSPSPSSYPASELVATATGTLVHRADCTVVIGRPNLRTIRGERAGLTACRLCNPF